MKKYTDSRKYIWKNKIPKMPNKPTTAKTATTSNKERPFSNFFIFPPFKPSVLENNFLFLLNYGHNTVLLLGKCPPSYKAVQNALKFQCF